MSLLWKSGDVYPSSKLRNNSSIGLYSRFELISLCMSANNFFNLLYQIVIILGVITLAMGFLHMILTGKEE